VVLKQIQLLFAGFCLLNVAFSDAAPFRNFTNQAGKTIEARITDFDPARERVSIEMKDGTHYKDIDISLFSGDDREYMGDWLEAKEAAKKDAPLRADSRVDITLKRGLDNDLNQGSDPDDRHVAYEPSIIFENEELELSFKKIKGTLVIIGESVVKNGEYHILSREDFVLDDLPARTKVEWMGKPFVNIYDDNPHNGSAHGADYAGYLVVLRDKADKVRKIFSSKTSWEERYERILKASLIQAHSRDFSKSFEKSRL